MLVDPAYRNVTIEAPAMRLILSLPAALKRLFNRGQAVEPVIWQLTKLPKRNGLKGELGDELCVVI